MKWIRRTFAGVLLAALGVGSLVLWLAQPGSDHRALRTWFEVLRLQSLGSDDRAPLAETFRSWDEGPPFGVLTAASRPHEFPRALRPIDIRYAFEGESRPLSAYLDRAKVQGLLALHGGEVVLEKYRGNTTAESRYHLWSA